MGVFMPFKAWLLLNFQKNKLTCYSGHKRPFKGPKIVSRLTTKIVQFGPFNLVENVRL
jgi:hypothetical protein